MKSYVLSNSAILDDLGARFKIKPGNDCFFAVKNYPATFWP